ncbi:ribosome maturation factor RimM [Lapidilactobacillus wuchangensis]|uniref:ribosome maturation factor RimM n=1 Tax=Lapidilactobacillus wuchangensis TaxID=2486001 RepID=UPI000F7B2ED7|nr:ribosome maturation factor RimM [Lapidilactobacillus wuchangensis]
MATENYYQVGRIVNTHGVRGEVKVMATTDFPEKRFKVGQPLFVQLGSRYQELTIKSHRRQQQMHLLTFTGYDNLDQVLPLKTHLIYVTEAEQHHLAPGEYYYRDIVGLTVVEQTTGAEIGVVKEILAPGANDVWVIQRPKQADLLLPYLKSVVLKIDLAAKRAYVEVPAGLDD